ncbi:ETC complex I subunit [Jiella avicenniae]|uniref:ETC complex I subunit n=1 Tax=Jiella avicenniae TaxID=2907202 RepID=A0A9X1T4F2_9HYPH|nr:ETC complex I subunit [Jiella avicenniae]MCE7028496.1 ETC complex I subunit [Jiella avicenniae]
MVARIFQPSRTAMQSGKAKTRLWMLEYEPAAPKQVEPLMGYTSSRDMRSQVRLTFDTKEQAIEYAERNGIDFRLEEPHPPKRVRVAYADNFKYDRRQPWTH